MMHDKFNEATGWIRAFAHSLGASEEADSTGKFMWPCCYVMGLVLTLGGQYSFALLSVAAVYFYPHVLQRKPYELAFGLSYGKNQNEINPEDYEWVAWACTEFPDIAPLAACLEDQGRLSVGALLQIWATALRLHDLREKLDQDQRQTAARAAYRAACCAG